ncbi:hypothetical protein [Nocardia niigatensis]
MAVRYELHGVKLPGIPQSVWRFGEPDCPLRLAETPTGLGGAAMTHIRQKNARQAGATYRGTNRDINIIGLTVRVGPVTPGAEALDLFDTWRDSLGVGEGLAEFHVISDGGGDRFQWVRAESAVPDPDLSSLDIAGWLTESVSLSSDESWWNKAPIHPAPFTPATFAGKRIRNDGDTASWPLWQLTGPGKFSIGVDGEKVTLPTLAAGEVWTVETNPEFPHIKNAAGVDKWPLAGAVGWYRPVPPRDEVPITLEGTGTSAASRIEMWLPQKFVRAAA